MGVCPMLHASFTQSFGWRAPAKLVKLQCCLRLVLQHEVSCSGLETDAIDAGRHTLPQQAMPRTAVLLDP